MSEFALNDCRNQVKPNPPYLNRNRATISYNEYDGHSRDLISRNNGCANNQIHTSGSERIQIPGHHNTDLIGIFDIEEPRHKPLDNVRITADLLGKLKNFPDYNAAPFFIEGAAMKMYDYADNRHWKWQNPNYARLPISPLNRSRFNPTGNSLNNWNVILTQLLMLRNACENNEIKAPMGRIFKAFTQAYHPDAHKNSNFEILNRPDLRKLLQITIPVIVHHALNLPNLLSGPIPILGTGQNRTIHLTRKLCCSLVANAFFCTFPPTAPNLRIPDINFFRLYNDNNPERSEIKGEKLKCLLNYFKIMNEMEENFQNEIISFERRCIRENENWKNSAKKLCDVTVKPDGKIEDADGMLQVDFANKWIGGGVLGNGIVMEEIRFVISPEFIVSRLFTEQMDDDEVVIITGGQIFSRYKGYHTSFKFDGPLHIDVNNRELDELGRTFSQIVAMDAIRFRKHEARKQFEKKYIDRELHKCKVGFHTGVESFAPVATGNWGCGAFNGNNELKFLIQWMAASQMERHGMQYHTWRDHTLTRDINDITTYLERNNVNVGELYERIVRFNYELRKSPHLSIFQFLKAKNGGGSGCIQF